ncbi:hypothetical protein CC117_22715 [Parafrankia colletiae]|uniref:Secreted protein n=1 Tax=Parafrankia colletiae TaxID=573497 RepID=A0A1S1QK71_9ACTN|nr:hypothetical protein [Parafrankia colletiae]MCK9901481.1 hypothetical protein [Frankia sp. Cpl3]OHV33482.1 hypothetical protein CC117_22715 [Parafrankia colletiae]
MRLIRKIVAMLAVSVAAMVMLAGPASANQWVFVASYSGRITCVTHGYTLTSTGEARATTCIQLAPGYWELWKFV